jgi:5-methylcytosine-specific restriction endonuclease McrA
VSSFRKVCFCGRQAIPGSTRCDRHPAAHQTQAERIAAQPWRAGYLDPLFAHNRQLAYKRDGGRCVVCGFEVSPKAFICDHVLPLSDGGTSELGNLQTLCSPCNKTKTRTDRRARAGIRTRG